MDDAALDFARSWHVLGDHQPLDEFQGDLKSVSGRLKPLFYSRDFYRLFDFLEFALQSPDFPHLRKSLIAEALESNRAGWRVVGEQLVPFGSEDEAEQIADGIDELQTSAPAGVNTHLRNSASALSAGRWADSVRESIHATEAAARAFDDKATLGEIGKVLRANGTPIHPALTKSLASLYGYASDEQGIRHSLTDQAIAAVDESEALLLYGLCVSFTRYLIRLL